MKILCGDILIHLLVGASSMNSMLFVGLSQMGKTFACSHLMADLLDNGYNVNVIDMGDKWGKADKDCLVAKGALIKNVSRQGLVLPFQSKRELLGCARHMLEAWGFQSFNAIAVLRKSMNSLLENRNGFSMLELIQQMEPGEEMEENKEWKEKIHLRLDTYEDAPDIQFGVCDSAELLSGSTIWDLSEVDEIYARMVTHLLLYCLYCVRKGAFHSNENIKPSFIVLDEFQTLDIGKKSILGMCLTEGQKYGINMVLLTQFLRGNFSDALISQFKQGGFRFYFRLTEEEARAVSQQLAQNTRDRDTVYQRLTRLPKGQCLMVGLHSVAKSSKVTEKYRFIKIEAEETEVEADDAKMGDMGYEVAKKEDAEDGSTEDSAGNAKKEKRKRARGTVSFR